MFELQMQRSMSDPHPVFQQSSREPRPRCSVASEDSPSQSEPTDVSPHPKRRPSATSGNSSQKSKKRVVWKGKACAISFPLDDERGRRPLLTGHEVAARVEKWQRDGWDTRGFQISSSPTNEESDSQTCRPYPDTADLMMERERDGLRIAIPNQEEWDAYVARLKEEKLRALGVTSSTGANLESVRSALPSSISRSSSRLPGQSISPPMPTSSGASNLPPYSGRSFSPTFQASNRSSRVGSIASFPPQFATSQNAVHHSIASVAYPAVDLRMTSPLNQYPSRPNLQLHQEISPSAYSRQISDRFSPPTGGVIQSLGQALTPVSPLADEMNTRYTNGTTAQIGQKVEAWSKFDPYPQHQRAYTRTGPYSHFPRPSLHPGDERQIVHPSPQGHQRNISEALQKEIDAAEAVAQPIPRPIQRYGQVAMLNDSGTIQDSQNLVTQQMHNDGAATNAAHISGLAPSPFADKLKRNHDRVGKTGADPGQALSTDLMYFTDSNSAPSRSSGNVCLSKQGNEFSRHKSSASATKLNVEAEEFKFNSRSQRTSSNFIFAADASQPSLSSTASFSGNESSHKAVLPNLMATAKLNAGAPSFKPSTMMRSTFQFRSAAFNVDAPEFNPGQVESKDTEDQKVDVSSASGNDKIFTNISIDPAGKTTRRGKVSRALPIRQADTEEQCDESEDGRVRISAARQKRARVQNLDEDTIPLYADGILLQDDHESPPLSEFALNAPAPAASGGADAARKPLTDKSPNPRSMKRKEDGIAMPDGLNEAVETPRKRLLSAQSDHMLTDLGQDPVTIFSSDQQRKINESLLDDGDGIDHLTHPASVASLSPLPLANGAVDKPSDSFPLVTKSLKAMGLEASVHAPTAPSLPPGTNALTESLLQQTGIVNSKTPPSPGLVGEEQSECNSTGSRDEKRSVSGEITALAAAADDVEEPTPSVTITSHSTSSSDKEDQTVLSYDEIDAVMKQFEDNSDLGVERLGTPTILSTHPGALFLNPSINIRSDAPSPSPRRNQLPFDPVQQVEDVKAPLPHSPSSLRRGTHGFNIHRLEGGDISDWNDAHSVDEEQKFESRAQFFDSHVDSIVGNILQDRLGPVERRLEAIQHAIGLVATQRHGARPRTSTSDEMQHSDADDEDEDNESQETILHRTRSPVNPKKDRKGDLLKTAVLEALASHKQALPGVDQSAIELLVSEVRSLKEASTSTQRPDDIKAIVEDVISTHPRLRGKRVQEDHLAGASQKFSLQIDGLESMLKVANERVEEEYRARRKVEEDLAETARQLNLVREEAAQYREASEEAEHSLRTYCEERGSIQDLEQSHSDMSLKNAALETTLEEYRLSHDQWLLDVGDERRRNQDLKRVLHALRREVEESSQTKQILRAKLERLQHDMTDVVEKVAHDQASWVRREQEWSSKIDGMNAELQRETLLRQKMELELDDLDREHKAVSKFRDAYAVAEKENRRLEALLEQTRQESRANEDAAYQSRREVNHLRETADAEASRLEALLGQIRQESRTNQDEAYQAQRELSHLRESTESEASRARAIHEHEITLLQGQHDSVRDGLEAQISRLQAQLRQSTEDAEEIKVRHHSHVDELIDRHARTLHESNEIKEAALEDERRSQERALNDLRARHGRALHNASDDKHRLEAQVTDKLALSNDKIHHLEGKVTELQDRLEIANSAARAAALAAAAKNTSESRMPIAPPLTSTSTASMSLAKGSNVPEKISPQALRESIMVLQDQLQNREQSIETLEADLARVDTDAPKKIKDRDTEITWLRELLAVRIDDLEDLIHALSEPAYDREAVKDAVIRLKANLEMERQEKERAATGLSNNNVFPSISSLSSLTQTPRALPLAAAAAWTHWRKGRDPASTHGSEPTTANDQTPSRPSAAAAAPGFLSGLLTPPRTKQRASSPAASAPPPPRRIISQVHGPITPSQPRPLRAGPMSARHLDQRPLRRPGAGQGGSANGSANANANANTNANARRDGPGTPPLMRGESYDRGVDVDADLEVDGDVDVDARRRSLIGDVDEDASPLGSGVSDSGEPLLLGEPFEGSTR